METKWKKKQKQTTDGQRQPRQPHSTAKYIIQDTTMACSNGSTVYAILYATRCAFAIVAFLPLSSLSFHPHSLRNIVQNVHKNGFTFVYEGFIVAVKCRVRFRCCRAVHVFVLFFSFIPHFVGIFIHNVHACWNCINSASAHILGTLHGTFLQNKALLELWRHTDINTRWKIEKERKNGMAAKQRALLKTIHNLHIQPTITHSYNIIVCATIYCYRLCRLYFGFCCRFCCCKRRVLYILFHYRITTDCCYYYCLLFCIHMWILSRHNHTHTHSNEQNTYTRKDTHTHGSHFRIHYNSLHSLQSVWRYAKFIIK